MAPGRDLLRDGLTWLEQQRTAHMTGPVIYRRTGSGGQTDAEVQATFGKTDYEVADDYGATIRTHVIDFLIMADDLGHEPQTGDVIIADGRQYEVMAMSEDIRGWRWSHQFRTTFRIHTKDIGNDT